MCAEILDRPVITREKDRVLYDFCPTEEVNVWMLAYIDGENELCLDLAGGPFAIHPDDALAFASDVRRLALKAKKQRA